MANEVRVLVTGDFCPMHRLGGTTSLEPRGILGELYSHVDHSHVAMTNLECPVSNRKLKPMKKTGPNLVGRPEALGFLREAGFNLVTLANNHIMDYGDEGLRDTLRHLEGRGVEYVGAGESLQIASRTKLIQIGDRRLAVVNVAENEWSSAQSNRPGAHGLDPVENYATIKSA